MNKRKKILAAIIVLLSSVLMLNSNILASEITGTGEYTSTDINADIYQFTYSIGDENITSANDANIAIITKYICRGTGATASFPNTVTVEYNSKNYILKVRGIGDGISTVIEKDASAVDITAISIPANVQSINNNAFKGFTDVNTVTLANGSLCETIGDYAFYNCTSLTTYKYYTSVNWIYNLMNSVGVSAFENTKLTDIHFGDNVEVIGDRAFANVTTMLQTTLGKNLRIIGEDAFLNCPLTTKIQYNCVKLEKHNNQLMNKQAATIGIGGAVTELSDNLFEGCSAVKSITVPNSITVVRRIIIPTYCKFNAD